MNSRSLKLDEFIAECRFGGEWEVSYTDGTHLKEGEYVKLGDITIEASEEIVQRDPILPFTFRPVKDQQIECRLSELPQGRQSNKSSERIHTRSTCRQYGTNRSSTSNVLHDGRADY